MAGSPDPGSWKVAAPFTGTALAGPIFVPVGCAPVVGGAVGVVVEVAVGVAAVVGTGADGFVVFVGAAEPGPIVGALVTALDEPCRSRPIQAIEPAPRTATAPAPSVTAPTSRRRSVSTGIALAACAAFSISPAM